MQDDVGSLDIKVIATDPSGETATQTFTLTIGATNDAPVSVGDAYSTDEDTALVIPAAGVLVNDTDDDGDALDAVLVSDVSNGALTLNADGSFTYTPNADFNGADSFTYKANDGTADGNTVTVDITVNAVNDAPVGAATAALSTSEDVAATFSEVDLLGGFTDVDADNLSVANLIASQGELVDNKDGTFTLTPPADFNGEITLDYDVEDANGGSVAASTDVTVGAVNDAPTGAATAVLVDGVEDTAYIVSEADLLAGVSDVDGDELSVENLTADNGVDVTDNNDGTFTLTPPADFNGEVALSYDVTDGELTAPATQSVTFAGVNDAPTVTAIDAGIVTEDDAAQTIDLLAGASDVEGDDLSAINITVTDENGDAVAFTDIGNGTISIDPAQFGDALDDGDSRTVTVSYNVSDGTDTTPNTATLVVTGADEPNTAPVAVDDVLGDGSEPVSEFLVNEFTNADQSSPSITALAGGGFVVTWQSSDPQQGDTSSTGIKARIFNADGTEAVSEFLVNEFTNYGQWLPSTTALEGGGFVVTWDSGDPQQGDTSFSGVKARIFNADGTEAVSEFLVNELTNGYQYSPSITALEGGGFVVTWYSNDPQQGDTSGGGVKARIFNADGTEAISEFLVNELTNGGQGGPSITALAGGGFVVTWQSADGQQGDTSDWGVKARIFNADGTEAVSEFLVNEFTNSHQRDPSITALEGGGFVVTWWSSDGQQGDTSDTGIKARIFNADGTEAVSEFLVNEFTNDNQFTPSITALEGGGFVVTWYSNDPQQGDTSGAGVKARIFNADGTEAVSEFLVNEFSNDNQHSPQHHGAGGRRICRHVAVLGPTTGRYELFWRQGAYFQCGWDAARHWWPRDRRRCGADH